MKTRTRADVECNKYSGENEDNYVDTFGKMKTVLKIIEVSEDEEN